MNTNYGRWIDADSLIMALETREVPELQTVKDIIATQPTVFDVNHVIESLTNTIERNKDNIHNNKKYWSQYGKRWKGVANEESNQIYHRISGLHYGISAIYAELCRRK